MSSTVTLPVDQLKSVVANAGATSLLSWAATALVLYEHTITIGVEVQHIWRRDISGATLLFILMRYIVLADRIIAAVSLSYVHTAESCYAIAWLQAMITSILVLVMSAVAAIRVFALWNRDVRLFVLVMVTGMFPAFINLFFQAASTAYVLPNNLQSCQSTPVAISKTMYMQLSLVTRTLSIFSDGLVVVLTWLKTYKIHNLTRGIKLRLNYSTLILRDGTVYFLAVCALNLIGIIWLMNLGTNLLNDLIVAVSAILMMRFLLNLRIRRSQLETISLGEAPSSRASVFSVHRFSSNFLDDVAGDDEDGGR